MLGADTSIPQEEFYAVENEGERRIAVENIILTAEFRKIPQEANCWWLVVLRCLTIALRTLWIEKAVEISKFS